MTAPVLPLVLALLPAPASAQAVEAIALPASLSTPDGIDLAGDFTLRMCIRMVAAPEDLPALASNKAWESGEVRDYTTNNAFGLGRESGALAGFALSVLPDGAWTWNAGDGRRRVDHRPEVADQGIADGRWHEVGFALDRARGVAHLYHDGRRVALHDLGGLSSVASEEPLRIGPGWAGFDARGGPARAGGRAARDDRGAVRRALRRGAQAARRRRVGRAPAARPRVEHLARGDGARGATKAWRASSR